ncbi:MAG: nickel pincer cofactor biosynthesis protein LarC [Thermoplasmata archaeon]|nr:nickel pincer cofactor biosynthesis protein LarC [Thermoplasmata archaeon]
MIAYFDVITGVSGDMFLSSLIDAGFPEEKLREELKKLHLDFELVVKKRRDVIEATTLEVMYNEEEEMERHLSDILTILENSEIDDEVKGKAKELFHRLAEAEAKIHGTSVEKIHFHEVGAVDTIVDIVGSLIALKGLGIEEIYSSPVVLGKEKVKTEHGVIPVPAPATLELLKGKPVRFSSVPTEMTTPTGAVLISMAEFSYPEMEIKSIGYGMGKKKMDMPNVLRVVIGKKSFIHDLYVIETNIDDMSSEVYPFIIERLLGAGAMDAFVMPAIMKKGRAGNLLRVIAPAENLEEIKGIIFNETSTLGIRYHGVRRHVLERRIIKVETEYGEIRVKVGYHNGKVTTISPEYEDCRRIAEKSKVPLKKIYEEARERAKKML